MSGFMSESVSASDLGSLLAAGKAIHLVDVRTPAEFAECHVRGARLVSLDTLNPHRLVEELKRREGEPIYLLCKSGARATRAAAQFHAAGIAHVTVVAGGTDACVTAGVPVERGVRRGVPLEGQVRIGLGLFLLIVWICARYVHPGFDYVVPGFAVSMMITGYTGFCGMALILARAPWNRR